MEIKNLRQSRNTGLAGWQADAEPEQEAVHLVDRPRAVLHHRFTHAVKYQQRLLRLGLRRHKSHCPTRCRFANRFSIDEVILV